MIKFQEQKPYELFQLVSWLLLIKSIELQKYLAINYYAIKRVNFSKLVIVFVFLYNKVRYQRQEKHPHLHFKKIPHAIIFYYSNLIYFPQTVYSQSSCTFYRQIQFLFIIILMQVEMLTRIFYSLNMQY